jgi:ribosome-associated protein
MKKAVTRPRAKTSSSKKSSTKTSSTKTSSTKTRAAKKPSATPRLPFEVKLALTAALEKQATDVKVLDLGKGVAFTDYFVICTGGNIRQVQAIADSVQDALKKKDVRPTVIEGYQHAQWILLDYFDFIVHVFTPVTRDFYSLERLWGDAVSIEIPATYEG